MNEASGNTLIDVAESLDIMEVLIRFIAVAFIIAALLAIAFIFFGGISFILSGGNEEKIKQAISTIRYSIIGLIFSIGAIFLVGVVAKFLGVSDTIYFLKYSEILESMRVITDSLNTGQGGGGSAPVERLE